MMASKVAGLAQEDGFEVAVEVTVTVVPVVVVVVVLVVVFIVAGILRVIVIVMVSSLIEVEDAMTVTVVRWVIGSSVVVAWTVSGMTPMQEQADVMRDTT